MLDDFGYSVIDLGNLRDGGLTQQAGGPLAGRNLLEQGERHKMKANTAIEQNPSMSLVTRRKFVSLAALSGVAAASLSARNQLAQTEDGPTATGEASEHLAARNGDRMADEIKKEKIRRAVLAGPPMVTSEATVAEMDRLGNMTVLRAGRNDWVCIPGDQNIVGWPDMAIDPMGMLWFKDLLARKPKPTNTSPGLIYMLNGATQRSFTDPFDITSPPIPIGPHWMILWPFEPKAAGLSTVMRDAGHDGDVRGYAV